MNEYDSNRILDLTKRIGYEKTNDIEECNCYIINTCHIREKATDKVYHDVGRLKMKFKNNIFQWISGYFHFGVCDCFTDPTFFHF